jgi:hypothetical protein
LSESDTVAPPPGAAALNVTVPVDAFPPTTLVGLTDTDESAAAGAPGSTVIAENRMVSPFLAESWTTRVEDVGNVAIVKLPFVAPAGMVRLDGTLARLGIWLLSVTTSPPAGAGFASVILPVDDAPPATLSGFTVNDDSVGGGGGVPDGFTVSVAACVTPPPLTEIVTIVVEDTVVGASLKKPRVSPAKIVIGLGTAAIDGWLLVAVRLRLKVAVDSTLATASIVPALPPTHVDGVSVSEIGCGDARNVTWSCTVTPFHSAVIVAVVSSVTWLAGMLIGVQHTPAGIVKVGGGFTAG